ncbi:MAG: ParB/RepB/Spo0J family partition protein [Saccharofermentans sp.]|nr:ParB/RepB/Spo0J family partition protein [Saccharofermentans sp.]
MKNNKCSSVVMISRSRLHPHPDNPRKDLGDLDELRESIREHGVMQNLTVIPKPLPCIDEFYILIGHRRYAASEGILTELPCVIVEGLSDREQIGIMLCENLQRADLTFIEQAHGFQMMIDLGDTVESISEKTGFSTTTVRHRLEIAKLDKKIIDEVQKETSWQIGINDYIELEKVKDIKERSEILEESSSSDDLKYNVSRYLRDKLIEDNTEKTRTLMNKLGIKEVKVNLNWNDEYKKLQFGKDKSNFIYLSEDVDYEDLESTIKSRKTKTKNEIVCQFSYSCLYIAEKLGKKKDNKKTKAELERDRLKENEKALTDARKQICTEFANAILDIDPDRFRKLEKDQTLIPMITALWKLMERAEISFYSYTMKLEQSLCKAELMPLVEKYEDLHIVQKMMTRIVINLSDRHGKDFCDWQNKPEKNRLKIFDDFYDVLYGMGLRLSNEFEMILEGSSALYEPEDEEEA